MSTSTPAPAPANGPALTTLPKTISTGAVASIHRARIHARIHHSRKHHNKPVKRHHHKAIVAPPPPPKITPPASGPKLPAGVKVTSSVATPSAVRFKATYVLAAALLGGFLILLLAFPAELFNKTYEENEEEIHVVFTRMGLERHHLSRWVGYLVYILVGAGLSVWLALQEGSDGNGLAVAVGLIVALPLVTFAFEFPAELYLRTRSKIPGQLRVLPTALLVGAVCAVISRAIHLEPAYLYGIFAGYTAMRADALAEEEEGKSVMVGVTVLFLVAGISWFAWGALNGQAHGLHRDWFVIIVSTSFFWIFVLAAEGLVFGLIPLKYMDGAALRGWRTIAWLVPQLLAAAFFIYVQMLDGDTRKIHTFSDVIKPFIVFAGFGLLSFAFWGYFQWKGRPSAKHGGDGGEHGEEIPAAPPVVAAPAAPAVAGVELLTFVLPTRPGDSPPPGQDG